MYRLFSFLRKMRLIASGLAQEGIEVIRDIRGDNEDWADWNWYSDTIATSTVQDYRVEYDGNVLAYADVPLKIDANGFYQYTTGNNTPFYRVVTLKKESFKEVRVTVLISWKAKGQWHYLTAEDELWNWW